MTQDVEAIEARSRTGTRTGIALQRYRHRYVIDMHHEHWPA